MISDRKIHLLIGRALSEHPAQRINLLAAERLVEVELVIGEQI